MFTISLPLNDRQERKLQKWIQKYNKQRVRNNQTPFATYEEALRDFMVKKIRACVQSADVVDARTLQRKFIDLDEEKQDQIKQILEM